MGTFTAWGFAGEIDAIQWAKSSPHYGSEHGVVEPTAWEPSTVPGSQRAIRIQPGQAFARGVHAVLAGTHDTVAGPVASGTRWDTLCARWAWTGGGSIVTRFAQGSTAQAISGDIIQQPGTTFDQPIALVQWTAGQDTATQVVDLRRWATKKYTAQSLLALADLPVGAVATVGGVDYTRVIEGGSLGWSTGEGWFYPTVPAGWETYNGWPRGFTVPIGGARPHTLRYTKRQGVVYCEGVLRKTVPSLPAEGSAFFTLPIGYRPTFRLGLDSGWAGNRTSRVTVDPGGLVLLSTWGNETADPLVSFNFSFVANL